MTTPFPASFEDPFASRPGRKRRRWPVAIVALVVLVVAGFIAYPRVRATWFPDTFDAPEAAQLPAVVEADATRAYFAGPGLKVVQMRELTRKLTAEEEPPASLCAEVMTVSFPALGTPTDVTMLIAQIPDVSTAEMALGHLDALRRWLGGCSSSAPGPRDELIFTGVVLDRRLEELT